jgi:FkbM family methyltransferase
MKKILKATLKRSLGVELYGLLTRLRIYRRKYISGRFSRFNVDKKLERLLPHRNGFYVELGANDGAFASNSYYFELKKGWRGVLIEPAPNLYLSCVKRRGKRNHVFCNACVPFDFSEEFVAMRYADSMSVSDSLSLDIEDKDAFVESGVRHLLEGERVFGFGAKGATLTSLLDEANAPALIDFLSLDVEGAELAVLKGVDFGKYNFKYMVVECRDISALSLYLVEHGYEIIEKITHHDYLIKYLKTCN